MKVCLIINFIPTSENIRGASALPYHIIAGAKESLIDSSCKDNIEFIVYSVNFNDISDEQITSVVLTYFPKISFYQLYQVASEIRK